MPEKVTSLNGLKVTSEYCSYSIDAHNVYYVKCDIWVDNVLSHIHAPANQRIHITGFPLLRSVNSCCCSSKLKQVCGNSPSDRDALPINQIENRVTRVGLSISREIVDSPFFKNRKNALTDMPVRHNADCLIT